MVELITKKELEDFLVMQDKISELIKAKTTELSLIKYGRLPEGESIDFDIYDSESEPGCMFVDYETYECGESNHDSYYLPFEFLYDETAPLRYKEDFEERKRLLKEKREKERIEQGKNEQEKNEKWEREELQRLKEKYEGK